MLNKAYEKFPTLNGLIFHSDKDGNINMLIISIH